MMRQETAPSYQSAWAHKRKNNSMEKWKLFSAAWHCLTEGFYSLKKTTGILFCPCHCMRALTLLGSLYQNPSLWGYQGCCRADSELWTQLWRACKEHPRLPFLMSISVTWKFNIVATCAKPCYCLMYFFLPCSNKTGRAAAVLFGKLTLAQLFVGE